MEALWMLERRCRNPGGGFGRLMKSVLAMTIAARIAMAIEARSQSTQELLQRWNRYIQV